MVPQAEISVRLPQQAEQGWIENHLIRQWGSTTIIRRGQAHDASRLPALVAVEDQTLVGLATFHLAHDGCELVTLDALSPHRGVGSALLAAVAREARARGSRRVWLITTNDNLDAIRFYQRRGMRLTAVHRGAVDDARHQKPSIPQTGDYGIPIHDELAFELQLHGDDPRTASALTNAAMITLDGVDHG